MPSRAAASALQLDRFVPYRLSVASNVVSDLIAGAYQRLFGLKIPEWRLIAVIAEAHAISQFELVRRTRMDKVTVSRAAIALGGRGLVVRAPHASDGRAHRLGLSDAGRELYAQVAPRALEFERALLAGLDETELETFLSVLDRLATRAETMAREAG